MSDYDPNPRPLETFVSGPPPAQAKRLPLSREFGSIGMSTHPRCVFSGRSFVMNFSWVHHVRPVSSCIRFFIFVSYGSRSLLP